MYCNECLLLCRCHVAYTHAVLIDTFEEFRYHIANEVKFCLIHMYTLQKSERGNEATKRNH